MSLTYNCLADFYTEDLVQAVLACLVAHTSLYWQVQLCEWEMATHFMGIPGSKQENFLFSFHSLLLSDYVKT